MKSSLACFLVCWLAASPLMAGSRIEIPIAGGGRQISKSAAESKAIKNMKTLNHPWRTNQPMPAALAEAGLGDDASLVFSSVYLDGGSRVFALKDGSGRYFVFCTTKPKLQAEYDRDQNFEERFYIAAAHWTDNDGVVVPRGSKTEDFLLKFIGGRVVDETP